MTCRQMSNFNNQTFGEPSRMKIGLIGRTGGMGEGFALRWAFRHDVIIGSREAQKATEAAKIYTKIARVLWESHDRQHYR